MAEGKRPPDPSMGPGGNGHQDELVEGLAPRLPESLPGVVGLASASRLERFVGPLAQLRLAV